MKFCAAATLLVLILPLSMSDARTWTSASGKFTVEAELVKVQEGDVLLRKEDGSSTRVPLDQLSEADRKFVAAQAGDLAGHDSDGKDASAESSVSDGQMRTWTSRGGKFTIEARFVEFSNGKAELIKSTGEKIAVPLSKLSDADARYVREVLAERRKASSSGTTASPAAGAPSVDLGDGVQTVQLKPLLVDAPLDGVRAQGDAASQYLLQMVSPQSFYQRSRAGSPAASSSVAAFNRLISKEPKYEAAEPFRAVARLGTQEFAFALDAVDSQTPGFGRLFFDTNHNGDLTDDKPIQGVARGKPSESYAQYQFPRVELKLAADGQEVEYAFLLSVYSRTTSNYSYNTASLAAAAFREGTLGSGRNRVKIVLIDSNSNGRFDDLCNVSKVGASGQAYPRYGDTLVVGPNPAVARRSALSDSNRFHLSKLIAVGQRFYNVAVTPAGDRLTLTPSPAPVGYVTTSNRNFSAVLYSEEWGVLKIAGDNKTRMPLPAGRWQLASYSIDATPAAGPTRRGGLTSLSAAATNDTAPIIVTEGETTPLEFGAPYRPVVTSSGKASGGKVYLSLNIIGAAGERCTSLRVGGSTPPAPEFQIVDAGGKVVEQGKFAYG